MKLRTWIALGLLVVGIAGCSADQELRELKNEDGWILGTVIPFGDNELVIPYRPGEPRKLAILECDPRRRCEVLAVDPLTGGGAPTRALFYPVADGLVFSVSNLVYHYQPEQGTLTHFELATGGGVLYVVDGVVHVESAHSGRGYDLATGENIERYRFETRRVPPVFSSREEIDNYSILSHEITDETRSYYEKLLDLTPVDGFGRPIEE